MTGSNIFSATNKFLKDSGFQKNKTSWYKKFEDGIVWIIYFQKENVVSKGDYTITLNVAVYVTGIREIIWQDETEFVAEAVGVFRKRPKFFGSDKDWWSFTLNGNSEEAIGEIDTLVRYKILPFLSENREFDQVVKLLPTAMWEINKGFHAELLRLAAAYLSLKNYEEAKRLLDIVAAGKSIWFDKAEAIKDRYKMV